MSEASGSSFYWAMRMMAAEQRQAMFAIYAYCREVDDIADDQGLTAAERMRRLEEWRAELGRLYAGAPTKPLAQALTGPVARYGLDKADFLAVIAGVEMDVCGRMRRPPLAVLDAYCDRVASAVGRLAVRVFGETGPAGLRVADALGRALQLTNILRDVEEDAGRDRLYLPDELLTAHGIGGDDPQRVLAHPALRQVKRDLALMAKGYFGGAWTAMGECSGRTMRPAAVMAAVYAALLNRLEAGRAPHLPFGVKLWYALRYGLL